MNDPEYPCRRRDFSHFLPLGDSDYFPAAPRLDQPEKLQRDPATHREDARTRGAE